MPVDLEALVGDLVAETDALLALLNPLDATSWAAATPAAGWSVADQVSHLAYYDDATLRAIRTPDEFRIEAAERGTVYNTDDVAEENRHLTPKQLLRWFTNARSRLVSTFAGCEPGTRLPWYGVDMSAASMVTARLMETWAHGQDVADTVGAQPRATARLRHIAHLGVQARSFSFVNHGLEAPTEPIRVELIPPDGAGELWEWGPADAENKVTGTALDFCLVVTQRRHRDDTKLVAEGPLATRWLEIAQAFAGEPGPGREPGFVLPDGPPTKPEPVRVESVADVRAEDEERTEGGDRRPIRIANCSGFYGDRAAAMRELVDGGPIDVLTGDYLAELTMLILWKARQKDPDGGYATTFLTQLADVLDDCLDRGIKVVSNAGGLNPAGLAAAVDKLAVERGRKPKIAYVTGDDVLPILPELLRDGHQLAHLDTGRPLADAGVEPVTANAYLGGWGIAAALEAGADIVICPRVTDAALVVGPAAWWHGWRRTDWDRLAGAVAAGHLIECGTQVTGGNYSFLAEVTDRRRPGFPIAEVAADGSGVITKHADTGGLVSVGTVTAQLLYEIAEPAYANPDVVACFDTVRLEAQGPDRVRVSGVRGAPPPETTKVALNYLGGYRNTMTLVVTGLDVVEKAAHAEALLWETLGGADRFAAVDVRLLPARDQRDAPTNEAATARLTITVKDPDRERVDRAFSAAVVELTLGGYAGAYVTTPPTRASAYGVYWPTLVPADLVHQQVVLPDGATVTIARAPETAPLPTYPAPEPGEPVDDGETVRVPLGTLCGARSGDKGGNANVGLWARSDAAYGWLCGRLDVPLFRTLLPEAAGLEVRRYELPNVRAVNFVVVGLLGEGVASSTRPDPQAKGLGEFLRSRLVRVPRELGGSGPESSTDA